MIKELCCQLSIEPIHGNDPSLWDDLLRVCKDVRDFMVHPKFESNTFNRTMKEAFEKQAWGFPSQTAQRVIGYFFEKTDTPKPNWLQENQAFTMSAIEVREFNDQGDENEK